jgi:hypothetical protein
MGRDERASAGQAPLAKKRSVSIGGHGQSADSLERCAVRVGPTSSRAIWASLHLFLK